MLLLLLAAAAAAAGWLVLAGCCLPPCLPLPRLVHLADCQRLVMLPLELVALLLLLLLPLASTGTVRGWKELATTNSSEVAEAHGTTLQPGEAARNQKPHCCD